jgi:hypothetical protein
MQTKYIVSRALIIPYFPVFVGGVLYFDISGGVRYIKKREVFTAKCPFIPVIIG